MKKQKVLKVLGAAALVGLTTLTMTSCSLTDWIDGIIHPTEKPETPTPTPSGNDNVNNSSGGVIVDGKEIDSTQTINYIPQTIKFSNVANQSTDKSMLGAQVTINAKVLPEEASNKDLNWSMKFDQEQTNNELNQTPDDCLKLVPNDGAQNSITLTLNKLFFGDIILTVSSSSNPNIKKSIKISHLPLPMTTYFYTYEKNSNESNFYESHAKQSYSLADDGYLHSTFTIDDSVLPTWYLDFHSERKTSFYINFDAWYGNVDNDNFYYNQTKIMFTNDFISWAKNKGLITDDNSDIDITMDPWEASFKKEWIYGEDAKREFETTELEIGENSIDTPYFELFTNTESGNYLFGGVTSSTQRMTKKMMGYISEFIEEEPAKKVFYYNIDIYTCINPNANRKFYKKCGVLDIYLNGGSFDKSLQVSDIEIDTSDITIGKTSK